MRSSRSATPALVVLFALLFASCANQLENAAPEPVSSQSTTTSEPEPTTTIPATTTTATTTPLRAARIFTSYEFPAGLIDGRPTQIQGLLGVPEGEGPFPLAIVMHGSHPACVDDFLPETFAPSIVTEPLPPLCGAEFPEYIRHDIGLGHIVTALNNAGVAAISIDVDSAYVWWGGEPDELATVEGLVATHFDAITRLNNGDDVGLSVEGTTGRFDLDDVSLIGHSRSGGHVVPMISSDRSLPFDPTAIVMMQPAVGFPGSDLLDVPVLLVRGECDEDVGPEAGLEYVSEVFPAERSSVVADMWLPAAGHRMLNTGLNGSTCPERGDRGLIQAQVAQAVSSFVASDGTRVELIDAAGATVDTIRGTAPETALANAVVNFDPADVPFSISETELLTPWPENADYSDALIEDF